MERALVERGIVHMGELAFRFRPGLLLHQLKRNSVPERVRGATESRTRQETRRDRSDRCTSLPGRKATFSNGPG